MTIGVGQGKSMAMLVSANTVVQACENDVNGMLKRNVVNLKADEDPAQYEENPDDDHLTVLDDDDEDWLPSGDPVVEAREPKGRGGKCEPRAADKKKPRPYSPRPLPPLPDLPPLRVSTNAGPGDHAEVDIPWTSLYKYLGFMLRADLLDDHAYQRVELKTKVAAERLFPHHRLVKAWPLGLKLQTLQTLVLSVTSNVLPLLTSMRCASESKTTRLDQLRKRIARVTLRLYGSARHAYVTAEAGLGDVMGDITQHRLRLSHSLSLHPLHALPAPPVACRVQDIMAKEAELFNRPGQRKHSLLLAPWDVITDRIVLDAVTLCDDEDWQRPTLRREVTPYASAVARVGERGRWIKRMQRGMDWMCDSFALRPPPGARRQTAALHFTSRLTDMDAGPTPKLTPLSYHGPRGSPIVALSRRRSRLTAILTNMRQGEASMEHFPFVDVERWSANAKGAGADRSRHWKQCHLCASDGVEHRFDLWHVLFECSKTCNTEGMLAVHSSCQTFLPRLCDALELAIKQNEESMSDTRNAGVSHSETLVAISEVQDLIPGYQWNCVPGRWLVYMLLLAMPYPEVAVRPDAVRPVWLCPPKRKRKGIEPPRNLRGMPVAVPVLSDEQYAFQQQWAAPS